MNSREIVTEFRKSSASVNVTNDCVEVAHTANGGRAVRDSKSPDGPVQFHIPTAWAAFLHGVKAGQFDN